MENINEKNRLIVKGARQVDKTELICQFADRHYAHRCDDQFC